MIVIRALANQLLRDLKASWQKSAILAILLIVGLAFWIPPLLRAFQSNPRPVGRLAAAPMESSTPSVASNSSSAESSSTGDITWQTVERVLESDPLVRSADAAAIRSEPFRIDQDQFPPPILFAEGTLESKPRSALPGDPMFPGGLALKSTIVGASRRAAYINKKLYFEGTEVRGDDGQTYVLKAVHPRKVVLEQAGRTFELKIADRAPIVGAGTPRDVMDDVK